MVRNSNHPNLSFIKATIVDKKSEILNKIGKLRVLVGFLGEKSQLNWWDTNFLSKTGMQFLEINFPRSAFAAGCNSVIEAARRLHDNRIGKGGVYHLFRFPTGIEEELHHLLIHNSSDGLKPLIESKEKALEHLKALVSNSVGAPEGPVQIGTSKKILTNYAVQEFAVHYYEAFQNQMLCFPYLKAD